MDPPAWQEPKWTFHNFGNLLRPLELVPSSRECVVPTEWQILTVLEDCKSKSKLTSIQAPQYRNMRWLVTSWILPI